MTPGALRPAVVQIDVVVIGAGPAGLGWARAWRRHYERGRIPLIDVGTLRWYARAGSRLAE